MSKEKQQLAAAVKYLLPDAVQEHRFHSTRKWRFDHADPEKKIAVEYEGIMSAKSRHTSITGYSNDCEKYGKAALMGWIVIRVTALMVRDGRAWSLIEGALARRRAYREQPL